MKKPNQTQSAQRHRTLAKTPAKGFTLVEMLVVVVIIAVLGSFGFSAFRKARTKAFRVTSANNLRTLHAACAQYSADNNMDLPNAFVQANASLGRAQTSWRHQLVEGGFLGSPDYASGPFPTLYKVLGSPIQWRETPNITIGRTPPAYPTYGMNIVKTQITGEMKRAIKVLALTAPSRRIFISEGHLPTGSTSYSVGISPFGAIPNNTDGIITFVYADGHLGQMTPQEFPTSVGAPQSKNWYFWDGVE